MSLMTESRSRITIVGTVFLLLAAVIVLRLGYLQVWKHDYFSVLATQTHSQKFEIPAKRGEILMRDRDGTTPVAMNRNLKTLYADTRYIYDEEEVIRELKNVLGKDYSQEIKNKEYVVLEEEVEHETAEKIKQLELSGIGLSDNYTRVYPEDSLGSQVIGFLNHDKQGQYGIEGHYDDLLSGTNGMFDAETDAKGIPIATSDNVQSEPIDGDDIVLTIDRNIQAHVEKVLKESVMEMNADSAHAVIMDPDSGEILSMANYPTFNPNEYNEVEDYGVFQNKTVSNQFEPGSGFKIFTMAAGLESGSIAPRDSFYDKGYVEVGDHTIKNVEAYESTQSMTNIITKSLNTGVVHVLKQMGSGSINQQAKNTLYKFFVNRFNLTSSTGIEQPSEPKLHMNEPGSVGPVEYANMTFGQGITTTMTRMVASMGAVVNDGVLYAPSLVDYHVSPDGTVHEGDNEAVKKNVVSPETSREIRRMMETVVDDGGGYGAKIEGYRIGGKTGTAQVPDPEGGYYEYRDIGTFTGFAPIDNPEYIMMVRVDNPDVPGYAGSAAAGVVFGDIMEWLLLYEGVPSEN